MKNYEFDKLFTEPEMVNGQYEENIKKHINYNQNLKKYFIENYPKDSNMLEIYLGRMNLKAQLNLTENIKFLHIILRNIVFFNYFKKSNLFFSDLIKILTIYNNSSDYFLYNIKIKEEVLCKKIKKLKSFYNNFIELAKELDDFELWFGMKSEEKLNQILEIAMFNEVKDKELIHIIIAEETEWLVDFNKIFENYYENLKNIYKNKCEINLKEKNKQINYFIRELIGVFEAVRKIKIPNEIIIELVSLAFDKQINEDQFNNILKSMNKHPENTSYTIQCISKGKDSVEVEYIKTKDLRT